MAARRDARSSRQDREWDRNESRNGDCRDDESGPAQGHGERRQPSDEKGGDTKRREHRSRPGGKARRQPRPLERRLPHRLALDRARERPRAQAATVLGTRLPASLAAACLAAAGLEVLLRDSLRLVQGQRVGFLTNQSAVTRDGRSDSFRPRDEAEGRDPQMLGRLAVFFQRAVVVFLPVGSIAQGS